MTITQTKPEFLTEALIEVLNNEWKVNGIESGRSVYTQLEIEDWSQIYQSLVLFDEWR